MAPEHEVTMPKAVNTIGTRAPKDESQKSDPPQYAVLAVRDPRSMFGAAEAIQAALAFTAISTGHGVPS